jgi:hypothetical protein
MVIDKHLLKSIIDRDSINVCKIVNLVLLSLKSAATKILLPSILTLIFHNLKLYKQYKKRNREEE